MESKKNEFKEQDFNRKDDSDFGSPIRNLWNAKTDDKYNNSVSKIMQPIIFKWLVFNDYLL